MKCWVSDGIRTREYYGHSVAAQNQMTAFAHSGRRGNRTLKVLLGLACFQDRGGHQSACPSKYSGEGGDRTHKDLRNLAAVPEQCSRQSACLSKWRRERGTIPQGLTQSRRISNAQRSPTICLPLRVVLTEGFEPPAWRISDACSNQLNYASSGCPAWIRTMNLVIQSHTICQLIYGALWIGFLPTDL